MSTSAADTRPVIVVADDDRSIRFGLSCFLEAEGYRVVEAQDGAEALSAIAREKPVAVLLDLKMPNVDGLAVLAELGSSLADLPVIVVTAYGGSAAAIKAMRQGAYDYLTKPFDLDEVGLTLKRALEQKALTEEVKTLRGRSKSRNEEEESEDLEPSEPEIVGQSALMRDLFKAIGRAAATDEPVLITGESGTGKELVASALHRHGRRSDGPFVRVNCAGSARGAGGKRAVRA